MKSVAYSAKPNTSSQTTRLDLAEATLADNVRSVPIALSHSFGALLGRNLHVRQMSSSDGLISKALLWRRPSDAPKWTKQVGRNEAR